MAAAMWTKYARKILFIYFFLKVFDITSLSENRNSLYKLTHFDAQNKKHKVFPV